MAPSSAKRYGGLRVLIAGGGVAGLEALLALRALAGDLVDLELIAPEPHCWYRPLAVAEPFGTGSAEHFELATIAESVGASCTLDRLASVDSARHVARTAHGAEIEYDALVIACGAIPRPALSGALNFRDPADSGAFRALLDEVDRDGVRSIAFAVPTSGVWPLPLYELALLTAAHLAGHEEVVELALVTPQPIPLAIFGARASDAVHELLAAGAIELYTGRHPSRYESGRLELVPEGTVPADRVVTLPRLEGLRILGIPQDADGFVTTDLHGRAHEVEDVYAAGDVTRFPVKQGGLAAQQADAVAEAIAARAGAVLSPRPFRPVLRGLLLSGAAPWYLRNELSGGRGETSTVAGEALWWPSGKIVGRYLAPYLARAAGFELEPPVDRSHALTVEVDLS
jgi:sulfide:quinone oxidoreductase